MPTPTPLTIPAPVFKGRDTSGAAAMAATIVLTPQDDGVTTADAARWPATGFVYSISVRQTDGAAGDRYSWELFSEDPTAVPGGRDPGEFLIAAGVDLSAVTGAAADDNRAFANANTSLPDVYEVFPEGLEWERAPAGSTAGALWLRLTSAANRSWTAWIEAGPVR